MQRQLPVRRKEIVYRRTYVDHVNSRFDEDFAKHKPLYRDSQTSGGNYIVFKCNPTSLEDVKRLWRKTDELTYFVRKLANAAAEKKPEWNDQTKKIDEISDRLAKLEQQKPGVGTCQEVKKPDQELENEVQNPDINQKMDDLSAIIKKLQSKVDGINSLSADSIDEILCVVNDTRCDLEEKIINTRKLGEQKWFSMEQKLDLLQNQQAGVALKMQELVNLLSALSVSSRSRDASPKIFRSSPSSLSSSTMERGDAQMATAVQEPKKEEQLKTLSSDEILERVYELNSLRDPERQDFNSESSESMIAPLDVETRRLSQPALYQTRTHL
ncbi:unnamed protein product [Caenorhabditis auriculariae]|uniref:Uncharacterized protein n=1 Tax=Caenorhabditis auriculariae TaxID=2777116 RepID=A0A8S1H1B2_9PELO|nr:unnamed protein product [Caenorhabditis auriculariae]